MTRYERIKEGVETWGSILAVGAFLIWALWTTDRLFTKMQDQRGGRVAMTDRAR